MTNIFYPFKNNFHHIGIKLSNLLSANAVDLDKLNILSISKVYSKAV